MIRDRTALMVVMLVVLAVVVVVPAGVRAPLGAVAGAQDVTERALLDNARVTVVEYVFPAGFRGEEHAAIADEFAYVLDGEFGVVTKGVGKRVVRRGEIEYASKGTVHYSLNETRKPARVLVVLLKER
jgi:quercetin dioxygenase-like cupin family protein